eukprot:sb/3471190/
MDSHALFQVNCVRNTTVSADSLSLSYCKQPIRTRYLGHVTGYQPIRDQYVPWGRDKEEVLVDDIGSKDAHSLFLFNTRRTPPLDLTSNHLKGEGGWLDSLVSRERESLLYDPKTKMSLVSAKSTLRQLQAIVKIMANLRGKWKLSADSLSLSYWLDFKQNFWVVDTEFFQFWTFVRPTQVNNQSELVI